MPYGLTDIVLQKLNGVFAGIPEIREVILFGSRAKGNFREGSDIDLAIKGAGFVMEHLRKTEIRLDDLMLPYRIDLVIYAEIKEQALKDHIDRVGIILYRSGD